MEVIVGYLNVFCKTKDYPNALALVDWALAFYPGLKKPEKRSYMDKSEAFLWAIRADIQLSLCNKEDAISSPRQAKDISSRFDEAPNYRASSIRFVSCQIPATAFDDLGDSAMVGIDDYIASQENLELHNLRKMKNKRNAKRKKYATEFLLKNGQCGDSCYARTRYHKKLQTQKRRDPYGHAVFLPQHKAKSLHRALTL